MKILFYVNESLRFKKDGGNLIDLTFTEDLTRQQSNLSRSNNSDRLVRKIETEQTCDSRLAYL